jgi:hypothetical protein
MPLISNGKWRQEKIFPHEKKIGLIGGMSWESTVPYY